MRVLSTKYLLRAVYLVSKIQPHPTKISRVQITNSLCLRPYHINNGRLQPLQTFATTWLCALKCASSDLLVYTQKHIVVLLHTLPHTELAISNIRRAFSGRRVFENETQKFNRHIHTLYSLNRALFVNQSLAPGPEWKSLLAHKYSFANF